MVPDVYAIPIYNLSIYTWLPFQAWELYNLSDLVTHARARTRGIRHNSNSVLNSNNLVTRAPHNSTGDIIIT